MVTDVLIFLMCYIIYICMVQGVFAFTAKQTVSEQ